jgi:hypothetical protein
MDSKKQQAEQKLEELCKECNSSICTCDQEAPILKEERQSESTGELGETPELASHSMERESGETTLDPLRNKKYLGDGR